MPVQSEHRFTVSDYYRMAETGVLRPNARVELLNGRIIDISPIGPYHSGLAARLSRFFSQKSKERWFVFTQNPLRLDDHSEPEPDIMLLRVAPDDYTNRHPQPEDVFLLVEVSDSSIYFDRDEKLPAYARTGIPEVWIVNLNEQLLELYREPNFTAFTNKAVLRAGDQATAQAFPDLLVDVAELLRR